MHHGRRVDDQGTQIGVRSEGPDGIGWVYATRWHDPDIRQGRQHRFVLPANGGAPELISVAFD